MLSLVDGAMPGNGNGQVWSLRRGGIQGGGCMFCLEHQPTNEAHVVITTP